MKIFKRILLLLAVILTIAVVYNYPKLNILAGYSAKNMASSVFVADRSLEFTDVTDNNFSPINLALDEIDKDEKSASASALGLLTRKAFYREGLGAALALTKDDISKKYLMAESKDKAYKFQNYHFYQRYLDFTLLQFLLGFIRDSQVNYRWKYICFVIRH